MTSGALSPLEAIDNVEKYVRVSFQDSDHLEGPVPRLRPLTVSSISRPLRVARFNTATALGVL